MYSFTYKSLGSLSPKITLKYLFKQVLYKIYLIIMERYCIVLQRNYRKTFLSNIIKNILDSINSCQNSYIFMKTITKKSLITNMKTLLDYSQNMLKYIDPDIEQFNTNIKNIKQILIIFAFVKFPVIFLSNNTQYNEKIIDYSTINAFCKTNQKCKFKTQF